MRKDGAAMAKINNLLPRYERKDGNPAPLPDASPPELVALARKQLDAGDDRQWAATLWAATRLALLDLARRKGIADDNLIKAARADAVADKDYISVATALDEMAEPDASGAKRHPRHYRLVLGDGFSLDSHHRMGIFKDYWWEGIHEDAVKFMKECYDTTP